MKADPTDVAAMLRFSSPLARAIVVLFIGGNATLAIATLGLVQSVWPVLVAIILLAIGAALVTIPPSGVLPARNTIGILAIIVVITVLINWNLPAAGKPAYATWHFGANTTLLFFMALRGRVGIAWLGFTAMAAITLLWTIDGGRGPMAMLQFLPNQAGNLLLGTIVAFALRRTSVRIAALHEAQVERAALEAREAAAARERTAQASYLNAVARPSLERIAEGAPFTDTERAAWLRVEATVRDGLRAFVLRSPALTQAVTRARERGVDVTLLDDSNSEVSADAEQVVVATIISELSGLDDGHLTARILPDGRSHAATIVITDGELSRRIEL
ncbi:MAG: hypothetical protein JWQ43_1979 [Glaciihabitans sp.]|nr:hypothetical protein [Glaciihabitans sp.]